MQINRGFHFKNNIVKDIIVNIKVEIITLDIHLSTEQASYRR